MNKDNLNLVRRSDYNDILNSINPRIFTGYSTDIQNDFLFNTIVNYQKIKESK